MGGGGPFTFGTGRRAGGGSNNGQVNGSGPSGTGGRLGEEIGWVGLLSYYEKEADLPLRRSTGLCFSAGTGSDYFFSELTQTALVMAKSPGLGFL